MRPCGNRRKCDYPKKSCCRIGSVVQSKFGPSVIVRLYGLAAFGRSIAAFTEGKESFDPKTLSPLESVDPLLTLAVVPR